MDKERLVYRQWDLVVLELEKLACTPCRYGWNNGTLKSPKDGGDICTHGPGVWQVGKFGPRGGWKPWTGRYYAKRAAVLMCDAFVEAANIPATGVR
jgi:hypothetical protein